MKISPDGIELIEHFEATKPKPYKDGGGVWTAGKGHTRFAEGFALLGLTLTPEQIETLFAWDLAPVVTAVDALASPQPQYRFDALVSLAFNVGIKALRESTLLRLLKNGPITAAAQEFLRWDHDNGKEVAGLLNRCKAEKRMFEGGVWWQAEDGKDIRVA